MPRWQPDTEQRLVEAALELYAERGYEQTTVGDIAQRVGVTSRTYFRYFPDKREVLFGSGLRIRDAIVTATSAALQTSPPFEAVLIGVAASATVFQTRAFAQQREAVVAKSEELRERELVKLSAITTGLFSVLVADGCEERSARLAADAGVAVFVEATRRWQGGDDTPFDEQVAQTAQLLRSVTAMPARS